MAAFHGRLEMVKILIKKWVDRDTVNCQGLSIRNCALEQGHQEIVNYMDGLEDEQEEKSKCTLQ